LSAIASNAGKDARSVDVSTGIGRSRRGQLIYVFTM
jgi:hypothetical protein